MATPGRSFPRTNFRSKNIQNNEMQYNESMFNLNVESRPRMRHGLRPNLHPNQFERPNRFINNVNEQFHQSNPGQSVSARPPLLMPNQTNDPYQTSTQNTAIENPNPGFNSAGPRLRNPQPHFISNEQMGIRDPVQMNVKDSFTGNFHGPISVPNCRPGIPTKLDCLPRTDNLRPPIPQNFGNMSQNNYRPGISTNINNLSHGNNMQPPIPQNVGIIPQNTCLPGIPAAKIANVPHTDNLRPPISQSIGVMSQNNYLPGIAAKIANVPHADNLRPPIPQNVGTMSQNYQPGIPARTDNLQPPISVGIMAQNMRFDVPPPNFSQNFQRSMDLSSPGFVSHHPSNNCNTLVTHSMPGGLCVDFETSPSSQRWTTKPVDQLSCIEIKAEQQNRLEQTEASSKQMKWLESWLEDKGVKRKTKTVERRQKQISIHGTQSVLRKMMLLMAQLQQETDHLSSLSADSNDEQWKEQKQKVVHIKKELENLQEQITEEETMKILQRKVQQRKKKRERMRRRRRELYEESQATEERREQLHAELDAWQMNISKTEQEKREERELKKSADSILNEVRKKISDTSKAIDLLKGIQKLRKLRSDRLKQQGVNISPASNQKFQEVIEEQYQTITKQKEIYLAEERALKVMLETEHEESKEKEREKIEKLKKIREEKEAQKQNEILFGNKGTPSADNLMFPFYQYYDQANQDYTSFIQIRREWDSYLVTEKTPGGSRPPDGFVIPAEPSSEVWSYVLKEST